MTDNPIDNCDNCDGYGYTVRPAGPYILQLNDLIKQPPRGAAMTIKQAEKYMRRFPSEIPGFTDRNVHKQCLKCSGSGGKAG
jgi:hypothetical protein